MRQYQSRTKETLKFLGERLGMGMTDTSDLTEHIFANENKNQHPPMHKDVRLMLEKYFEPLDEEWKKIVETNHMGMEDAAEKLVTLGKPAKSMWLHESTQPTSGRKIDQEWWGNPGKIYGGGGEHPN